MRVQLLHHLVVIRSHGTELGVESGQLRHVFERSPVGLTTRNASLNTLALIKAALDNSPDCS